MCTCYLQPSPQPQPTALRCRRHQLSPRSSQTAAAPPQQAVLESWFRNLTPEARKRPRRAPSRRQSRQPPHSRLPGPSKQPASKCRSRDRASSLALAAFEPTSMTTEPSQMTSQIWMGGRCPSTQPSALHSQWPAGVRAPEPSGPKQQATSPALHFHHRGGAPGQE